ncbi:MAG: aspartate aminotransferase family protein [Spirochaetia bacterium]
MAENINTKKIEDAHMAPFFVKQNISIERGEGVYVWDEEGTRYLDFTSGWGVTCIGHGNPVITKALTEQAGKIIQNPNSGLTYSQARARLLKLLAEILPEGLTRIFFQNSGAEANDAAIKLARKVTGRLDVIAAAGSFHGRTISTASATGQTKHRNKFNPLMPNYKFVPFNDIGKLEETVDSNTAAVILEPIQGEGGVKVPEDSYLSKVSRLCREQGALLIVDEIQTGFCRTGEMFAVTEYGITPDFITLAKGIAGGFPFAAFAMTEEVAAQVEIGDHGGTYCGNPLGCAVAYAVISYLKENNICGRVKQLGNLLLKTMQEWQSKYPGIISEIRGKGLLFLMELPDEKTAGRINDRCLEKKLFVRQTQGNGIRIFPALTITEDELKEGLHIIEECIGEI